MGKAKKQSNQLSIDASIMYQVSMDKHINLVQTDKASDERW